MIAAPVDAGQRQSCGLKVACRNLLQAETLRTITSSSKPESRQNLFDLTCNIHGIPRSNFPIHAATSPTFAARLLTPRRVWLIIDAAFFGPTAISVTRLKIQGYSRPAALADWVIRGQGNESQRPAASIRRLWVMRIAKQGLIVRCSRLGKYHGATVVIARCGKARGHIVAQERDIGAVDAVRERQCASSLTAIWRIAERGLGIEGYSGQIDNILSSEAGDRSLKVQGLCS